MIFIAVIFGFSFFYLGQTFFAGKKGIAGPFYTGPFCTPIKHAVLFCAIRPHERPQRKKPREPVAPLNAHLEIPTKKASRAHHTFTARLYLACRRAPRKAPASARPQPLKTTLSGPCTANLALFTHTKGPHAKTPGVIPGVWLMKSSFNLLLTHCGRFLAGCTGPACSRRLQ